MIRRFFSASTTPAMQTKILEMSVSLFPGPKNAFSEADKRLFV
jgi:hypothetical protein